MINDRKVIALEEGWEFMQARRPLDVRPDARRVATAEDAEQQQRLTHGVAGASTAARTSRAARQQAHAEEKSKKLFRGMYPIPRRSS